MNNPIDLRSGTATRPNPAMRAAMAVAEVVNDQWRVCFVWTSEGPKDIEIVDYH